ncbi:MAG: Fic family protein [Elusimicrobiota bacterium]
MNNSTYQHRSGAWIKQSTGYKAFIPKPLPPDPALNINSEITKLLSKANLSLGKLDGLTSIISDPDLFVYLFVRKEALLSSQIEGTQCSLEDILLSSKPTPEKKPDIEEVSNYVAAMKQGLKRLSDLSLSGRLIKEIHSILLKGVRGSNKTPGEFRRSQNWIGPPGATLQNATFVPPPPHELQNLMVELEKYIHSDDELPPLIKAGLIHAQFETLHPFLDGNGRLGRLLITFLLCAWDLLREPLLYLSYFFKANRTEYYSKLMNVRLKGDWEGWIAFFLRGVIESAELANYLALDIHKLHQHDREKIRQNKLNDLAFNIFTTFAHHPTLEMVQLKKYFPQQSVPSLQRALNKLIGIKIIVETSGWKRHRKYTYKAYLDILTRDTTTKMG